jgi:hypothetical protein
MHFLKKLWRYLALVFPLAALVHGVAHTDQADAQQQGREMISWVVLFKSDVEVTQESLLTELDRLWPGQFLPKRDKGSFVVEGVPGAQFIIQSDVPGASGTFLLHNVPGPYTEFSDMIDRIPDASLRDVARAQEGWMSVDLMAGSGEAEGYKFIGSVLARLAPADAAVLLHPSRGTAVRFTADVRRKLAEDGRLKSP